MPEKGGGNEIGNCGQDSQPSRRVINQQARSVISCERQLSAAIVLNATTKEATHLEVKFRFSETPRCVPRLKMSRPFGPRARTYQWRKGRYRTRDSKEKT